jgi:2-polyprenyl-3-methyl-5-hydroxy-6-metoxy-1,4-benzoquinol methylase
MRKKNLDDRQQAERHFHDEKFSHKYKTVHYEIPFGSVMMERLREKMGDLEGKKVVDFGCGQGWLTKTLASAGAEVWAFDISEEAVKKTSAMAKKFNLSDRVHVEQMPAEQLTYASSTFDLIVGNAILHHLDLEIASKEIKRVLAEGGKAYFMEPLGHNPLLNMFRKLTPQLRTRDEAPLRIEQFSIFTDIFSRFEHEEFFLVSMSALMWHFVHLDQWVLKTRDILLPLDQLLMAVFPFLRRYCWYSLVMMQK